MIILIVIFNCGAQNFAQLPVVKHEKISGWLFFSKSNFQYDWVDGVSEIRDLGFHDFFFPDGGVNFSTLVDSNLSVILKDGIRIDYLNNRHTLKGKASRYVCKDSSGCYPFNEFFILPVRIAGVVSEDYEPVICNRYYFELKILRGSRLRFEYRHKVFTVIDSIDVRP